MQRDLHTMPFDPRPSDEFDMFELAPIPLWLEDYSGIRAHLDRWRCQGVTDLRAFLQEDMSRVRACSDAIRLLAVNGRTLDLFEAQNLAHLTANLGTVFQGAMLENHLEELVQLWDGALGFVSHGVNHTLSGRPLDIQLKARVLPGHETDWSRILVSTEDVTEREEARRRLAESEAYARHLFQHSPVSLWVEDFSAVKERIEEVRSRCVTDFRTFLDVHPEFVSTCVSEVRILEINRQTLEIFRAPDLCSLAGRLHDVLGEGGLRGFRDQLVGLWNEELVQTREILNYTLDGEELHFVMQFSVLPGQEDDWSRVQIALTDITARKKAEAYLEYLGKHDVLTKLYNRSFYADELNRLERKKVMPLTVILVDLNGLKAVNDRLGHAAGDAVLRRAGEVFGEAAGKAYKAARIGGDEFAILMPGAGEAEGVALVASIEELVEINNQFYPGERLSMSLGRATLRQGERIEDAVKRADLRMYEAKRIHYKRTNQDRRMTIGEETVSEDEA